MNIKIFTAAPMGRTSPSGVFAVVGHSPFQCRLLNLPYRLMCYSLVSIVPRPHVLHHPLNRCLQVGNKGGFIIYASMSGFESIAEQIWGLQA